MKKFRTELNKLRVVHEQVKNLIDQYPPDRREIVIFDKWTLKDVVAHLNHWMVHDIDCIDHLMRGEEPYWHPDKDEFNNEGVAIRKIKSWEGIYDEFNMLFDKLLDVYKKLPPELQNKPIWKGYGSTPLKFIFDDIRHWEGEHIPSLESNLK